MNHIPSEYKPITPIGYIGYQLLFSLPIVGLIFLIIFAVGGTNNINVKNFARSYFVIYLIAIILIFILVFFFGINSSNTTNELNNYWNNFAFLICKILKS